MKFLGILLITPFSKNRQSLCLIIYHFGKKKEKEIKNDFISTEEKAHQLALAELLLAQSEGQPRNLVIANDPRIEKGDIIELSTGVKVYVQNAQRTLVRGQPMPMSISGFKSVV